MALLSKMVDSASADASRLGSPVSSPSPYISRASSPYEHFDDEDIKIRRIRQGLLNPVCGEEKGLADQCLKWLQALRDNIIDTYHQPYEQYEPLEPFIYRIRSAADRHGLPNVQVINMGRTSNSDIFSFSKYSTADYMTRPYKIKDPIVIPRFKTHYFRLTPDADLETLARAFVMAYVADLDDLSW